MVSCNLHVGGPTATVTVRVVVVITHSYTTLDIRLS